MRHNSIRNPTWTVLALLVVTVPTVFLLLLVDLRPLVPHPGPLSQQQRHDLEYLIVDNSPERFRATGEQEIRLDDDDINLLAHFLLHNLPALEEISARVALRGDEARLQLSIPRRTGPLLWHLNVRARLGMVDGEAELRRIRIGRLPLPAASHGPLERQLTRLLDQHGPVYAELLNLRESVRLLAIDDQYLRMQLRWESDLLAEIGGQAHQALTGNDEQNRILTYYREIGHLADRISDSGETRQLEQILPPLFGLAAQRSTSAEEATRENRALLQALTLYSNRIDPTRLFGEGVQVPQDIRPGPIRLHGRPDLGRHFVTAAAISASTGTVIAEILSNSKELHDARHTTGFSFSDMTANLAGVRFGETASDTAFARQLQQFMIHSDTEHDYMPSVSRERDGLSEEEFRARFGNRDSIRFRQEMAMIEEGVEGLALHRNMAVQ